MKSTKTYAEKLRDPRWQRLRLEVMESAEWQCSNCGDKESELQIHHAAYRKNAEPWEYEVNELLCLCAKCHKETEGDRRAISDMMIYEPSFAMSMGRDIRGGRLDEALHHAAQMFITYCEKNSIPVGYTMPTNAPEARVVREALKLRGHSPDGGDLVNW